MSDYEDLFALMQSRTKICGKAMRFAEERRHALLENNDGRFRPPDRVAAEWSSSRPSAAAPAASATDDERAPPYMSKQFWRLVAMSLIIRHFLACFYCTDIMV